MKTIFKKLSKFIFSRLFIFGLLFCLNVGIQLLIISIFNDRVVLFQFINFTIAFLCLFNVSSREMPMESKLSWIILILLTPLIGTTFYVMFSKNKMTKKQVDFVDMIHKKNQGITFDNKEEIEKELTKGQISQMNYLYNTNRHIAYFNNDMTYFKFGEDFIEDYLEELSKAKKFIFMEYFILENGKMLDRILEVLRKKKDEGVEIRLIYDDIGTISKLPIDFAKKLRQEGFKSYRFNRFYPVISTLFNNRDHRKITIIDGVVAYTGGLNLADEYCNYTHPFGVWKDNAIKIKGSGVDSFTKMFLDNYTLNRLIDEDYSAYLNQTNEIKSKGIIIPYGDGPRPFYEEYVGENVYINLINDAKDYIYITTPYLICDSNIKNALKNASLRGVDVRIVLPHIPDKKSIFWVSRSNYKKLQAKGVKIYEYTPGFIHQKVFLVDGVSCSVGTINLDYRSLIHHFENGLLIFNADVIEDIKKDFDEIFNESQSMKNFKQNLLVRVFCKLVEIFQPLL